MKKEDWFIVAYVVGVLAVFGVLPCALVVAAWDYFDTPAYAWIATVVVFGVDGIVLWFRNPFKFK